VSIASILLGDGMYGAAAAFDRDECGRFRPSELGSSVSIGVLEVMVGDRSGDTVRAEVGILLCLGVVEGDLVGGGFGSRWPRVGVAIV